MKLIVRTYEVVTPESCEVGDAAELGFADFRGNRFPIRYDHTDLGLIGHDCTPDDSDTEDGLTAVDLAVRFLQDDCYVSEPSSIPFDSGTWYSAKPERDYQDGSDTTYNYHLHGFSEAEEREIFGRLFPRRVEVSLKCAAEVPVHGRMAPDASGSGEYTG